jgi:hypothetical protein
MLGVFSAALLGVWIKLRSTRRVPPDDLEPPGPADRRVPQWLYSVDIDDDTAAEIIKRARPALERARNS